jgi:hypothetical protein
MASTYAWMIDTDHIDAHTDDDGYKVPVFGPSNMSDEQKAALEKATHQNPGENVHRFRMYDDDGELYYSGWFLGDAESEDGFGPLDDFGRPDAGAVTIEYKNAKTGKWEEL